MPPDKSDLVVRTHLFDATKYIESIEDAIDADVPFRVGRYVARDALTVIVAGTNKTDSDSFESRAAVMLVDAGMAPSKARNLICALRKDLSTLFRRTYGEGWKRVIAGSNISVKFGYDLVLTEIPIPQKK